jgi:homoserine O-acetyltransferase
VCEKPWLTSVLSSVLEGPKAALVASKDFDNGHYKTTPQHGLRAFGRVYIWANSNLFSTIHRFSNSSTSIYSGSWTRNNSTFTIYEWDADDLLTLLNTWKTGYVSKVRDGGDLNKCLSEIKAKGLIMPIAKRIYAFL